MKKSIRLLLTGAVQSMFFEQFVKDNAEKLNIRGFFRRLEDGRAEIFVEGDNENVDQITSICKRGSQKTQIRKVETREEKFQDFKDFRIIKI